MNNDYKCLAGTEGGTGKVLSPGEYLVPRWTRGTGKILSVTPQIPSFIELTVFSC